MARPPSKLCPIYYKQRKKLKITRTQWIHSETASTSDLACRTHQKIAETYKHCFCFVHTFKKWTSTVTGKHQKDHVSQAETLSAGT